MTTACPACGAPQPAEATYCPVCGLPRAPEHVAAITTEPERLGLTRVDDMAGEVGAAGAAGAVARRRYAGVGRRIAAHVIDSVALSVVVGLVLAVGAVLTLRDIDLDDREAVLAAMGVWAVGAGAVTLGLGLAMSWWEGATGAALGGRALGVRTLDAGTARPLGFGRALLRNAVIGVAGVVPVAGTLLMLLSPLFDASGRAQGWHDKAARAVVLRAARGAAAAPTTADAFGSAQGSASGIVPGAAAPATVGTAGMARTATTASAVPDPWAFPIPAAPQTPERARGLSGAQDPRADQGSSGAPDLPGAHAAPEALASAAPPSGAALTPAPTGVVTGVPPALSQPPAPNLPQTPGPPQAPDQPHVPDAPSAATPPPTPVTTSAPAPALTPVSDPAPEPHPEPPEDGWDETRLSTADVARLAAAPARQFELVLPDGSTVLVAGPTLVGRDPQSADGAWTLVPVADPQRSVSKTHAEVGVDIAGLWVADRGSTNGTVVSEPGRPPRVVEPGARARVRVGGAIHLGQVRVGVREAIR